MTRFLTNNRKQTRGFTLIDLLVAMAITSFLIMGMAQLLCHAILVKRKTDCSIRAAELTCQKIEHLRNSVLSGETPLGSQTEEFEDDRVNHIFLRKWIIHEVSLGRKRIELDCYAINYPRKKTRLILTLFAMLGF